MWNLMVVEDEPIVRMGLRYMINWEDLSVNWKAEASNGEEALRIMEKEDIHIVMTDIRMPGMDGLALAKEIRKRNEAAAIIFLSSYDNFPYVKEAIRLGAINYLHKPTMDEREVEETLRRAVDHLQQSVQCEPPHLMEKKVNAFLLSLLDKYTYPSRIMLPELLNEPFTEGIWLTSFRVRDDALHGEAEADAMKFLSIRYVIDEYVTREWGGFVFHRRHREILWLAPRAAKTGAEGPAAREAYLENLRQKVFDLLNVPLIYATSSVYERLEQIPEAYLEAQLNAPAGQPFHSLHVRLAKEYVDRHLCEDISLAKVAEAIAISPSYLSRIFLKEMGESFSDYVIRNKTEMAKKLLRETNLKVYEIADRLGHGNPHYFSKLFKERVGKTPLEYRNQ